MAAGGAGWQPYAGLAGDVVAGAAGACLLPEG